MTEIDQTIIEIDQSEEDPVTAVIKMGQILNQYAYNQVMTASTRAPQQEALVNALETYEYDLCKLKMLKPAREAGMLILELDPEDLNNITADILYIDAELSDTKHAEAVFKAHGKKDDMNHLFAMSLVHFKNMEFAQAKKALAPLLHDEALVTISQELIEETFDEHLDAYFDSNEGSPLGVFYDEWEERAEFFEDHRGFFMWAAKYIVDANN
jgi:hypothetical protein